MSKIKKFIKWSNISKTLINATIEQIGGWDEFKDYYEDICDHGINGGFTGFIYYHETNEFTQENFNEIMNLAKQQADKIGNSGPLDMFSHFGCFKDYTIEDIAEGLYNENSDYREIIFNGLCWYIGEEVCRAYRDFLEFGDEIE